jgi:hypothetical protein
LQCDDDDDADDDDGDDDDDGEGDGDGNAGAARAVMDVEGHPTGQGWAAAGVGFASAYLDHSSRIITP